MASHALILKIDEINRQMNWKQSRHWWVENVMCLIQMSRSDEGSELSISFLASSLVTPTNSSKERVKADHHHVSATLAHRHCTPKEKRVTTHHSPVTLSSSLAVYNIRQRSSQVETAASTDGKYSEEPFCVSKTTHLSYIM